MASYKTNSRLKAYRQGIIIPQLKQDLKEAFKCKGPVSKLQAYVQARGMDGEKH